MKKRTIIAPLAVAALVLSGAGIAEALSAGSGVLLCFPGKGAVVRGVRGACPRGYTKVFVGSQTAAVATVARVNALSTRVSMLSTFLLAKDPVTITPQISPGPKSNPGVQWSLTVTNAFPGSTTTGTLAYTTAGKAASSVVRYTVGSNTKVSSPSTMNQACDKGTVATLTVSAKDAIGATHQAQATATCS